MEEELSPEQESPAEECQPLKNLSADCAASCAVVHAAAAGAECEASPASPTAAREQPVTAREQRAKTPGRRPDRRSDLALGSHRSRDPPRAGGKLAGDRCPLPIWLSIERIDHDQHDRCAQKMLDRVIKHAPAKRAGATSRARKIY